MSRQYLVNNWTVFFRYVWKLRKKEYSRNHVSEAKRIQYWLKIRVEISKWKGESEYQILVQMRLSYINLIELCRALIGQCVCRSWIVYWTKNSTAEIREKPGRLSTNFDRNILDLSMYENYRKSVSSNKVICSQAGNGIYIAARIWIVVRQFLLAIDNSEENEAP